jgi:integrase/recombinase XerD
MNTLRQAAQEYLTMRRSSGYKLQAAGKSPLAFVTFMEQRRASYITRSLTLAWAKQRSNWSQSAGRPVTLSKLSMDR